MKILLLLMWWMVAASAAADPCARIVSLAPSMTEVLFSLGLGDNVVAVTRYCRYPVEAQSRPSVGGLLDTNFELAIAAKPSVVFLLQEQQEQNRVLSAVGIVTKLFEHRSISGIEQSISDIGHYCQREGAARALLDRIHREVEEAKSHIRAGPAPRVLVAIGGDQNDGNLSHLYISGRDGYYQELLALAQGENVFHRETVSLPMISREGLIALNPDVIIQIGSDTDGIKVDPILIRRAWQRLDMINAVARDNIFIFTDDFASIPGPRYPQLLKKFVGALYGS